MRFDVRRFSLPATAVLLALLGGCVTPPADDTAPVTPVTPVTPGSDRYSQDQDTAPDKRPDISTIPQPEPRHEPRSRYGNHSPYTVFGETYHVLPSAEGYTAEGIASWYGTKFHGHRTSSGEPYDMYQFTAAHRSLPLPTFARVTSLENGESVIVRINDRGPFHPDREIDLSWAAASKLGIEQRGTGRVRVEVITPESTSRSASATRTGSSNGQQGIRAAADSPPPPAELYLQVGAFGQPETAQGLVNRLLGQFAYPVAIRPGRAQDNPVYRVWLGPFATENDREQAHRLVSEAGYGEPVRVMP
ncbi:septal ring lytic transglycosylase RlpA family protein [Alcanivorax sp. JB21]|uniref:septal ring lytic transglycosylase RlpA family protein n=1 Tax=Alcanivorax limicola TaxID=2874102 RepID=UPI001CC10357|nr:septal ring lytic transglycosylase RlpA family protein [Alcanivorax limicola]MBZ2189997.1 septal ring lytic transglycosylase RlpA family protein [Alcanivorax limicola]